MANAASGALASLLLLSTIAAAVLQGILSLITCVLYFGVEFCGFLKHNLRVANKQRGRETPRAHQRCLDAPYGLS